MFTNEKNPWYIAPIWRILLILWFLIIFYIHHDKMRTQVFDLL